MVERGLRLREGLEEGLVGWGGGDGGDKETSDEEEAEVEADARELRRLMPY